MTTPSIAVVGTTRAGKSVFITVLAKHLERPRDGARLAPQSGKPKNTYTQIEDWWNELQSGNWLPPTPPGTLIELNWDFVINGKAIPLRMFDYAGETLTDLFNNRARDAEGAAKQYFDQVRTAFESASVLLVLLNLESLIEQGVGRATETKSTLLLSMTAFLNKIKADKRECRVCFVFTSYDRYEAMIRQRWGSVQAFLEQELPPLYYEVADNNPSVCILPVAAVSETETRIEPQTGVAALYPKSGFASKGFDQLVRWLVQATSDSKSELDEGAEESRRDEENVLHLQKLTNLWTEVRHSTQVEPLDRFLNAARCAFPHPHRPNISDLTTNLRKLIDAADDKRSSLVVATISEWAARALTALKSVAVMVAVIVGGRFVVQTVRGVHTVVQEERLRAPNPVITPGEEWGWRFNCNEGVLDCWEHRAIATIPIWNRGGAGNITATVTVKGKSQNITRFFNSDEKAVVTVAIGNLPDHVGSSAHLDLKAAQ